MRAFQKQSGVAVVDVMTMALADCAPGAETGLCDSTHPLPGAGGCAELGGSDERP